MVFTIPNEADVGVDETQAEVDSVDIAILVDGLSGDGVVSGCTATEDAPQSRSVAIASGSIRIGQTVVAVTGADVQLSDATTYTTGYEAFDLVEVNSSGTLAAKNGTPALAGTAAFPTPTSGSVVLCAVYRVEGDNTIANADIVDKRVFVTLAGDTTGDVYFGTDTLKGGRSAGTSIGSPTAFAAATEQWTLTSHGLSVDDKVHFTAVGSVPSAYANRGEKAFWVVSTPTADTFTLSEEKGGSALNGTGTLTGTFTLAYWPDALLVEGNETYPRTPAELSSPLEFYATDTTWTAKANQAIMAGVVPGTTLTMDYGASGVSGTIDYSVIQWQPTVQLENSKALQVLGGPKLFFNQQVLQNENAAAVASSASMWTVVDYGRLHANNANHSITNIFCVDHKPRLYRTTSGTASVTDLVSFQSGAELNDNSTATNRFGMRITAATTNDAGAVTSEVGVAVAALNTSVSTNSVELLLGTVTPPSGDWAIYSDSTEASHFDGPIQFDDMATPANPAAEDVVMYKKGDKFVWGFNDGGTMSYVSLTMTAGAAGAITDEGATPP